MREIELTEDEKTQLADLVRGVSDFDKETIAEAGY